jgi:hypothetical protein
MTAQKKHTAPTDRFELEFELCTAEVRPRTSEDRTEILQFFAVCVPEYEIAWRLDDFLGQTHDYVPLGFGW